MRLRIISICLGLLMSLFVKAQKFIPLWNNTEMPNQTSSTVKDSIVNERYYQVGTPGIYPFLASKQENSGAGILIFPGGGYSHLTFQSGGVTFAKWLNTLGINAFVVIYRLPNQRNLTNRGIVPIQDAQRAIKIIKSNAISWDLDTNKLGVLGTSAGGHLAALTGTVSKDYANIGDSLDKYPINIKYMILVSPVISMEDPYAHKGSRMSLLGNNSNEVERKELSAELNVKKDFTPLCFIAGAFNDPTVDPHNNLLFYQAMLNQKIPCSIHIFPDGKHNIGLMHNPGSTSLWLPLLKSWLEETAIIKP